MYLNVGVVGAGNVGSALLMELARQPSIGCVQISSRTLASAEAAVLDVLSAFPKHVRRFRAVRKLDDGLDVVVITAGVQHEADLSLREMLGANAQAAVGSVANLSGNHTIFVLVGSPVDELTALFSFARPDIPVERVIGFGGELDRSRLVASLISRGIPSTCTIVGEHGARAIPVYDGEQHYDAVANEVRTVLSRIRHGTGKARNLATGVALARLISAIAEDESVQCVTGFDSDDLGHVTWPHVVGRKGIRSRVSIELGARARADLELLLAGRAAAPTHRAGAHGTAVRCTIPKESQRVFDSPM